MCSGCFLACACCCHHLAVLAGLGQVHIVGTGIGALIAEEIARSQPRRVASLHLQAGEKLRFLPIKSSRATPNTALDATHREAWYVGRVEAAVQYWPTDTQDTVLGDWHSNAPLTVVACDDQGAQSLPACEQTHETRLVTIATALKETRPQVDARVVSWSRTLSPKGGTEREELEKLADVVSTTLRSYASDASNEPEVS